MQFNKHITYSSFLSLLSFDQALDRYSLTAQWFSSLSSSCCVRKAPMLTTLLEKSCRTNLGLFWTSFVLTQQTLSESHFVFVKRFRFSSFNASFLFFFAAKTPCLAYIILLTVFLFCCHTICAFLTVLYISSFSLSLSLSLSLSPLSTIPTTNKNKKEHLEFLHLTLCIQLILPWCFSCTGTLIASGNQSIALEIHSLAKKKLPKHKKLGIGLIFTRHIGKLTNLILILEICIPQNSSKWKVMVLN